MHAACCILYIIICILYVHCVFYVHLPSGNTTAFHYLAKWWSFEEYKRLPQQLDHRTTSPTISAWCHPAHFWTLPKSTQYSSTC